MGRVEEIDQPANLGKVLLLHTLHNRVEGGE